MHGQVADAGPLPGHGFDDRDVAHGGGLPDLFLERGVGVDGAHPHRPDRHARQHGRQAGGVIGVRVAEHHQVQAGDAATSQPRGHLVLVRAPVDQDPRAAPLDQDRIALSDVDRGDREHRRGGPGNRHQQDAGNRRHRQRSAGSP